jgi:DNA-binding response OmpR family regulator
VSTGTVVIADDDADIRALIALSVTRAGAVVAADVATGSDALLAIKQCVPDLAILDVSMPEMTGLQVCRAVRADPTTSDVRILVLSAAVHPAAVAEGGAAGADAYEFKPFSPRTLSERIREMLLPRPTEATE